MENKYNIRTTEVIPLDSALATMNIILNVGFKFPYFKEIKDYIFIQQLPVDNNDLNIIDLCMVYFCENDELINNEQLYPLFITIREHFFDVYNESEEDAQLDYSYDKIKNGITIFDNKNEFGYHYVYQNPDKIQTVSHLLKEWENLSETSKLRWLYFSLISMDYITLSNLENTYGKEIWHLLSDNCNGSELNAFFELMLINFITFSNWDQTLKINSYIQYDWLYFVSNNTFLHNEFSDKLNPENLATYISLSEVVNSLK